MAWARAEGAVIESNSLASQGRGKGKRLKKGRKKGEKIKRKSQENILEDMLVLPRTLKHFIDLNLMFCH